MHLVTGYCGVVCFLFFYTIIFTLTLLASGFILFSFTHLHFRRQFPVRGGADLIMSVTFHQYEVEHNNKEIQFNCNIEVCRLYHEETVCCYYMIN